MLHLNVSKAIRLKTVKFRQVKLLVKQQLLRQFGRELEVKESVYEIL